MTSERGDAELASEGEDQAVLLYLAALESHRSAPEGLPEPDTAAAALANAEMVAGDDAEALQTQLAESTPGSAASVRELEPEFVRAAAAYGQRHGMTYEGWRRVGVEPEVLARAGIHPDGP